MGKMRSSEAVILASFVLGAGYVHIPGAVNTEVRVPFLVEKTGSVLGRLRRGREEIVRFLLTRLLTQHRQDGELSRYTSNCVVQEEFASGTAIHNGTIDLLMAG